MNRFAIQEDDQFEIHIKQVKIDSLISAQHLSDQISEHMKNAAQEVMLKAQQGSGFYHFNIYKSSLI